MILVLQCIPNPLFVSSCPARTLPFFCCYTLPCTWSLKLMIGFLLDYCIFWIFQKVYQIFFVVDSSDLNPHPCAASVGLRCLSHSYCISTGKCLTGGTCIALLLSLQHKKSNICLVRNVELLIFSYILYSILYLTTHFLDQWQISVDYRNSFSGFFFEFFRKYLKFFIVANPSNLLYLDWNMYKISPTVEVPERHQACKAEGMGPLINWSCRYL